MTLTERPLRSAGLTWNAMAPAERRRGSTRRQSRPDNRLAADGAIRREPERQYGAVDKRAITISHSTVPSCWSGSTPVSASIQSGQTMVSKARMPQKAASGWIKAIRGDQPSPVSLVRASVSRPRVIMSSPLRSGVTGASPTRPFNASLTGPRLRG